MTTNIAAKFSGGRGGGGLKLACTTSETQINFQLVGCKINDAWNQTARVIAKATLSLSPCLLLIVACLYWGNSAHLSRLFLYITQYNQIKCFACIGNFNDFFFLIFFTHLSDLVTKHELWRINKSEWNIV